MEFRFTPEEETFREEVRQFLRTELPADWAASGAIGGLGEGGEDRWEFLQQFQKRLAGKGWLTLGWPKEHGGLEASHMMQVIYSEEMTYNRAPAQLGVGPDRVGPTIILYGSEQQKRTHLPGIVNAETVWSQGFSEPGAGSDLASLQTRAVADGDYFVVSGQKIWTSFAHRSDWCILLARTDPDAPKHKGISYFLLDMKSPGVEVRPLTNLANQNMFNEVFFSDVRVPARNLVGELNRGWYIGTTTLDFERSSIGSAVGLRQQLDRLVRFAKEHEKDGLSRTGQFDSVRFELSDRYVEANVARLMSYRVITMQAKGMVPNHEASMTKLYGSELNQRIARTGMKVLGLYGQIFGDDAPMRGRYESAYLTSLASTIAGGTSEIQRNIIATRGLGLPRD